MQEGRDLIEAVIYVPTLPTTFYPHVQTRVVVYGEYLDGPKLFVVFKNGKQNKAVHHWKSGKELPTGNG